MREITSKVSWVRPIYTIGQRRPNRILAVEGDEVIVGTEKSPEGRPVPIEWVQDAVERLFREGEVLVTVESVGYRSAFIGALLATIPDGRGRRIMVAGGD